MVGVCTKGERNGRGVRASTPPFGQVPEMMIGMGVLKMHKGVRFHKKNVALMQVPSQVSERAVCRRKLRAANEAFIAMRPHAGKVIRGEEVLMTKFGTERGDDHGPSRRVRTVARAWRQPVEQCGLAFKRTVRPRGDDLRRLRYAC